MLEYFNYTDNMFKFGIKNKVSTDTSETKPQLALLISAGKIKASIWSLNGQKVSILGMGEKAYSNEGKEQHVEYKTVRDAVADTIDIACNVAETDVHETTFGIPQSWMEEQSIAEEYEEIIEKINKELDVEGVAYVSIPHAISFLLQYMHKIPPTTFLVGSTREGAVISYVEAGKIIENHSIAWSGNKIGENIAKGIKLFKKINELPASVHLYGYGNLAVAQKELENYEWSKLEKDGSTKPLFVSSPLIYVLDTHVDIYAVSLVGAKDFAKQEGIKGRLLLDIPNIIVSAPQPINPQPTQQSINQTSSPHSESNQHHEGKTASQEDDISHLGIPSTPPVVPPVAPIVAPFGFVKNADIHNLDQTQKLEDSYTKSDNFTPVDASAIFSTRQQEEDIQDEEEIKQAREQLIINTKSRHPEDSTHTNQFSGENELSSETEEEDEVYTAPQSKTPRKLFKGKSAVIVVTILLFVLLGLGGGAVYAYINLPKTTVTIFVKPESLDKSVTITSTKDSQVSSSENTIPLQEIKIDVIEKLKVDATGTNTIGEKAAGTVIVYNKTTNERSIKKGTSLKVDNLEFEFDSDVTVASASASIEGQTNGKTEAKVTAKQIGEKSNIKTGVTLSIGSFARSELEADAKSDFTGGTEKQVKVVAAKDITSLRQQLEKVIDTKIPDLVKEKVSSNEILFDQAWEKADPKYKYDKKAGDESASIEGEVTSIVTAFIVKEEDIKSLLQQVNDKSVPQGYEKQSDNEDFSKEFISLKNGTLTFRATSAITIVPILNNEQIIGDIVAKKEDAARDTILQDNRIFDVQFSHSINLPEFILSLPQKKENISIERTVRDVAI